MTFDVPSGSLSTADIENACSRLGLEKTVGGIVVPLFGRPHNVTSSGSIRDADGHAPTPAVAALIAAYILGARPANQPDARTLVSFREFPGAGPLVDRFADNTGKLIAATFTGRPALLADVAMGMGGRRCDGPVAMDLFLAFVALPGVSMFLGFNDAEDGLPAQCRLFFHRSADNYLGLRHRFALGTYLAGHLIQRAMH